LIALTLVGSIQSDYENGLCAQIGNDDFDRFATRPSKSRLNFSDLLRAGHADYVINASALDCNARTRLGGLRRWSVHSPQSCQRVSHGSTFGTTPSSKSGKRFL
jgi:hypothetical protein